MRQSPVFLDFLMHYATTGKRIQRENKKTGENRSTLCAEPQTGQQTGKRILCLSSLAGTGILKKENCRK
jgi:hypothetical protein